MISIKNSEQLKLMRVAGRITGEALLVGAEALRDGVSTKEIDRRIRAYIEKCGARPSFLGYGGFPGSACISINNEVIHGIPSDNRVVKDGDIVKIDVGACYRGYHGDSARTFAVGHVSETAQKLINGFFEIIVSIIEASANVDKGTYMNTELVQIIGCVLSPTIFIVFFLISKIFGIEVLLVSPVNKELGVGKSGILS
jgi:methionyl aminopeptidase